ncbi:MAG: PAS domain S-box protein [Hyphomonadaceae bacterium]
MIWEVDYKLRAINWYGDYGRVYPEAFTFEQFADNTTTIIHVDDREALADYFHGVAAGETGSIEHRVMHPDGTVSWAEIWARRAFGRSGGIRKLIVMSKDITERKRQEASVISAMQRAEATLRAKRTLVRNVVDESVQPQVSIADADFSVADMYDHLAGLMEEMDARDAVLAETLASLKAAREAADAANVSSRNSSPR